MRDIIKGIKLIVSGLFRGPIKYIRSILDNKSTMNEVVAMFDNNKKVLQKLEDSEERLWRAILEKEKSLVNLHKKVLKSVTELESKVEGLETGGDILVKCVEAGKELETRLTNLEEDFDDIPILPYKQG